mmetsp:Transcript_50540/g.118006  ORF Transcript_50540/g.118006 Transcript_50540/m.118006 type:complete len:182 (+) Transcript_50540:47-592(+)
MTMLSLPNLALFFALLPLSVRAQSSCSASEWVSGLCAQSGDCEGADCDPCQAKSTSYGGCFGCLALPGCAWCRHSGVCRSNATISMAYANGVPQPQCASGWEQNRCARENDHVEWQVVEEVPLRRQLLANAASAVAWLVWLAASVIGAEKAGFWKPAATEGAVLGYGMVGMLGLAVLARCI